MKKEKVSVEDKLSNQDIDLFKVLEAIDKKDYNYYDKLSNEQQKKVVPFLLVQWVSTVKGAKNLQAYYLMNANEVANLHLFNENLVKHPKLQWMLLCAISPGIGKQFHQWIPHIRDRVSKLKEEPTLKEITDYFKKIYPKGNSSDIDEISKAYVDITNKKVYLANKFPTMKLDEIELLSNIITEEEIDNYEQDSGN